MRDLILLQEHWLTPCNLHKFEDDFPQYLCFAASAMRKCLESGVLYGRLFGGVCVLVKKNYNIVRKSFIVLNGTS